MIDFIRLILLLAIAGAAVTFLGSAIAWWRDEQRRLRRLVAKVLGGTPDGVIVAAGRGAAAGFRLSSGQVVVMRDEGAKALLYRLHALIGAELIVDDQVVARVMRDEPRRTLDQVNSGASEVILRLLFDDARHPDFSLALWIPRDSLRRDARPASAAIREARGWLARAEAIMRRAAATAPQVRPEPEPQPAFEMEPEAPETPEDLAPPFDLDDDTEDREPRLL